MNDDMFGRIKTEYDNFYKELLKNGKLPLWSTQKGFWNSSVSSEVYEAFKKIRLDKSQSFLDIGSGDGKVVLIASIFCRDAQGIEIDKFLHDKAVKMKEKFNISNASFHNKDFFGHDFSKYDLLFLAPDTPLERGIEEKLIREMTGKLILYGHHFHPRILKREQNFEINGNLISVYSK